MAMGIIGRKLGQTQIFTEDNVAVPVTVIEAGPCPIVQIKTVEKEGYSAIQMGFGGIRSGLVNRPLAGHFKRANVPPTRILREFRVSDVRGYNVGDVVRADIFKAGDYVDVSGTSKGRGFTGVVKRFGNRGGGAAHGSMFHRAPGSIGSSSAPSRVFKNQKLPGRMGGERVTVQNLKVVEVDPERNLLVVKGAVPGPKNGTLIIRKSVKKGDQSGG
ncbi:MAG: 50S ribosomal protein L3 [bacterium]